MHDENIEKSKRANAVDSDAANNTAQVTPRNVGAQNKLWVLRIDFWMVCGQTKLVN